MGARSSWWLAKPAAQCTAPEFRQLDFWVGDWATYEVWKPVFGIVFRPHRPA